MEQKTPINLAQFKAYAIHPFALHNRQGQIVAPDDSTGVTYDLCDPTHPCLARWGVYAARHDDSVELLFYVPANGKEVAEAAFFGLMFKAAIGNMPVSYAMECFKRGRDFEKPISVYVHTGDNRGNGEIDEEVAGSRGVSVEILDWDSMPVDIKGNLKDDPRTKGLIVSVMDATEEVMDIVEKAVKQYSLASLITVCDEYVEWLLTGRQPGKVSGVAVPLPEWAVDEDEDDDEEDETGEDLE